MISDFSKFRYNCQYMETFLQVLLIIIFLILNLGLVLLAGYFTEKFWPEEKAGERLPGTLLVYFFIITFILTFSPSIAVGLALLALASLAGLWRDRGGFVHKALDFELKSSTTILLTLFIVISLAAILFQGIVSPRYLHDPLTYQLTFPAAWLNAGKVHFQLVSTPFGDPSQAYAPSNASVYYLWLLAILKSDYLAVLGQWPFLVLALTSAIGISRRLGLKSPFDMLPGLLMMASPMIIFEAGSALSDLALAAYFTAAIYFLLRCYQTNEPVDLILGLAAAGLMAGTKYNGLPLLVLLLPLIVNAMWRVKKQGKEWPSNWALAIGAFGLVCFHWYVRNLRLTGSPIYPYELKALGITIFEGAFGREQMLLWVFHRSGWTEWWAVVTQLLSPLMLAAVIAAVLIGMPLLVGSRKIRPLQAYVLLLPLFIDRLNWHFVPFQMERFWTPAAIIAMVSLSAITLLHVRAGLVVALLFALDILLRREYLQAGPANWPLGFWVPCASVVVWILVIAAERYLSSQVGKRVIPGICLVCLTAVIILYPGHIDRRDRALGNWEFGPGWSSIGEQGATVAYAGANVPYPLYGPALKNRVVYVNINEHVDWAFHDYHEWYAENFPNQAPNTPEPSFYRMEQSIVAWWENLVQADAEYLLIYRLGRNNLFNISHSESGWPIEETWAAAHPELFKLYHRDDFTRVYKIAKDATATFSAGELKIVIRPVDAHAAYAPDAALGERFFPLYIMVLL